MVLRFRGSNTVAEKIGRPPKLCKVFCSGDSNEKLCTTSCSFKNLAVLINKDEVLVAVTEWSDIVEQSIGVDGGQIELNDCTVDFTKDSLKETNKVMLEMTNDIPYYPEDYLVMSPPINVRLKTKLQKPVQVTATPWCIADDDDDQSEIFITDIMHLEEGSDTWAVIKTADLTRNGVVQFPCQSFSHVLVAIRMTFIQRFCFPITGVLYAKGNTWCLSFRLDHKSVAKQSEEILQQHGFRTIHLPFNPVYARVGDKIEVRLKVDQPYGFFFDMKDGTKPVFVLNKKFLRKTKFSRYHFCLKKNTRGSGTFTLTVSYSVLLNDKVEDGGLFEFDFTSSPSGGGRKLERVEDAFQELLPRFASGDQFRKFAISRNGFCLSMETVTDICEDFSRVFYQKMEMLKCWKMKVGDRATAAALRQLVYEYFHEAPYAQKEQQLLLNEEFGDAMSKFRACHEWVDFATSKFGLGLPRDYVDRTLGDQQNLTREQQGEMLEKWRIQQGDSASADVFRDLVATFENASTKSRQ